MWGNPGIRCQCFVLASNRSAHACRAFVRRLADNEFRPESRDKYMSAYYWMDWLAYVQGVDIQHKLNTGREVKVGKYPMDGFVPASKLGEKATVFQFHGCYWHGQLCDDTRGIRDEKWRATRASKYQRTQETTAYLKMSSKCGSANFDNTVVKIPQSTTSLTESALDSFETTREISQKKAC